MVCVGVVSIVCGWLASVWCFCVVRVSPRAAFSRSMLAEAGVIPGCGGGTGLDEGDGLCGTGLGGGDALRGWEDVWLGPASGFCDAGCVETFDTTVSVSVLIAASGTFIPSIDTRAVAKVWNMSWRSAFERVMWSACGVGVEG